MSDGRATSAAVDFTRPKAMPVILLTDDEAVGGIEFDSRFGHWRCPHRQLSHRRKLRVNVQALSRELLPSLAAPSSGHGPPAVPLRLHRP